jgi:hypothetical protein
MALRRTRALCAGVVKVLALLLICTVSWASPALATTPPELLSPTHHQSFSTELLLRYKLPEAAAPGTLQLMLERSGMTTTVTLGAAADAKGEHEFELNVKDLTSSPEVLSASSNSLADGEYEVLLAYRNEPSGQVAEGKAEGVRIKTVTGAPSLTSPVSESVEEGGFEVTYSLPEEALAGSVRLVFEDEAHSFHTIVLENAAAGSHTVEIRPLKPTEATGVASGPTELSSGPYELTVAYQDKLGNPVASSTAVKVAVYQKSRCEPGWFSASGESPCAECAKGRYAPEVGMDVCLPSSPGHHVSRTGQGSEELCPAGTFSDETQTIDCTPAPLGHYAEGLGTVFPSACPSGTHDPRMESARQAECEPDRPGTYSAEAAAEATPCEAGTFASGYGNEACLPAQAGYYVGVPESAGEKPCPAGTYSSTTRSISCIVTPPDTYATNGAIAPVPCPLGTESPAGASSCTPVSKTVANMAPTTAIVAVPDPTFSFAAPRRQASLRRTGSQLYVLSCSTRETVLLRVTATIRLGRRHLRLTAPIANLDCPADSHRTEQARFRLTGAARRMLANARAKVTLSLALQTPGAVSTSAATGTVQGRR